MKLMSLGRSVLKAQTDAAILPFLLWLREFLLNDVFAHEWKPQDL